MGILDDFGKKAEEAAKIIGEKSEEILDAGRKKIEIQKIELDIKDKFRFLGKTVYNQWEKGLLLNQEEMEELCLQIQKMVETRESLKNDV
ncbi:hypothetical protein [Alkalibacter mobilis]|uniref:hypothetical protein n=1 Tax=Alkalibacter mobilis TaxID=2787712 RepID=UPI00189EB05A|nr:hypothetical protein [Alkalibacter mobilis]MBF7097191.1 hypothetical protein [Alkalibacter mobilis]